MQSCVVSLPKKCAGTLCNHRWGQRHQDQRILKLRCVIINPLWDSSILPNTIIPTWDWSTCGWCRRGYPNKGIAVDDNLCQLGLPFLGKVTLKKVKSPSCDQRRFLLDRTLSENQWCLLRDNCHDGKRLRSRKRTIVEHVIIALMLWLLPLSRVMLILSSRLSTTYVRSGQL